MLVQEARFLLLDEPFNAMDAHTTHALLHVLRDCVAAGKGVIAVVHDREQARTQFDNTLLLAREVVASGPSMQVLTQANLHQADGFRQEVRADEWCDVQPDQLQPPQHLHHHHHD